ncbi:MAG: hypothetical protein BWK78_02075 [Thiotrichaceae bacterium IS1]|nr:MAG: hypothetical protein BWK78_02075 [Thiotrichaceae bacterium IS1]
MSLPDRTIILEATASGNRFATAAVKGSQGSIQLKLLGFNEPVPLVDDDLLDLSGWYGSTAQVKIVTKDSGARQASEDKILRLTTSGEGPQSISRTFTTKPGAGEVKIQFRFITSEIPGGYFGSRYNDYYNVTIRSKSGGKVSNNGTMNGLGLSAFDANGATAWRDLSLKVDDKGDTVQIDLTVANVADGALDSSLEITTDDGEQEIGVVFTGSGAGRVVSDPAGIDCITGQPCEPKKFKGTVKLTAMTIDGRGLEVGNHFTAWHPIDDWSKSCAKSDTPTVCTLPATNQSKQVTVEFTMEQCFGGVGNGCNGAPTDAPVDKDGRITLWVSVGSIWHDTCCFFHPLGYACKGLGTKTADEGNFCRTEWDKAFPNLGGRGWTHIFGPYADRGDNLTGESNRGGRVELPVTLNLSGPDETELDDTDAAYCQSGSFASTLAFWHSGICGVPPAKNPPSQ